MDKIYDLFANNESIALVVLISLRERAVLLREARPDLDGKGPRTIPPSRVVDTYLNVITSAAIAFDASGAQPAPHQAPSAGPADSAQLDEAVYNEAWALMRFRTHSWEIVAFRQDAAEVEEGGFTPSPSSAGTGFGPALADQYLLVTFSEPTTSDGLGPLTSRIPPGSTRQ